MTHSDNAATALITQLDDIARVSGTTPRTATRPLLSDAEVTRRVLLLAELQAALAAQGVQSLIVRNRRIVLRSAGTGLEPSGPTDPQLHIFLNDGTEIATTDGTEYEFTTRSAHLAADPQAAAESLASRLHAHQGAVTTNGARTAWPAPAGAAGVARPRREPSPPAAVGAGATQSAEGT